MVVVINEVEKKFAGIICPYQLNIPLSPMENLSLKNTRPAEEGKRRPNRLIVNASLAPQASQLTQDTQDTAQTWQPTQTAQVTSQASQLIPDAQLATQDETMGKP